MEFDDGGTFFGFVVGDYNELGYFSLSKLKSIECFIIECWKGYVLWISIFVKAKDIHESEYWDFNLNIQAFIWFLFPTQFFTFWQFISDFSLDRSLLTLFLNNPQLIKGLHPSFSRVQMNDGHGHRPWKIHPAHDAKYQEAGSLLETIFSRRTKAGKRGDINAVNATVCF